MNGGATVITGCPIFEKKKATKTVERTLTKVNEPTKKKDRNTSSEKTSWLLGV